MKKVTAFLMSMVLMLGVSACSTAPSDKDEAVSTTQPQTQSQATEPDTQTDETSAALTTSSAPTTSTGGKTLVVYYSASGNTESVATYIATATGGDIFELVPAKEYSSADLDWTDQNSRVVYEHDHPEARNVELVKSTVDNWEEYDTVFIGYPIWWQIAAWPVDGFVKANDFTGKTVIPFCTSASSGLGESGELLADMAGTGNWLTGERFSSGASEETVRTWVESLNLG